MAESIATNKARPDKRKRMIITLRSEFLVAPAFRNTPYVIPKICTSCMKPTTNPRVISESSRDTRYDYRGAVRRRITTSSSKSMTFYTCPECQEWEKSDVSTMSFWIIFLGVLTFLVVVPILVKIMGWSMPTSGKFHAIGSLTVSLWVSLTTMAVVQFWRIFHPIKRPANVKPASPCDSVRFGWDGTVVLENVEYGRLFLLLNKQYEKQENLPRLIPEVALIKGEEEDVWELTGPNAPIIRALSHIIIYGLVGGIIVWLILILPYILLLNLLFGLF